MSTNIPYQRIVSLIDEKSIPKKVMKNIKLLSARKTDPATPFGSWVLRYQKYPGDVDLHENFSDCCSKEDVIKKFAKIIKRIVNDLVKQKLNYITEFKMGLDNRYNVDVGFLDQGIYYINDDIAQYVENNNKLLSSDEKKNIKEILNKKNKDSNDYDIVNNIFREHRILRWRENELMDGYKILSNGGGKMTIEGALKYQTHVKIDTIIIVNDKFSEMTNFWYLSYFTEDGKEIPINSDFLLSSRESHDYYLETLKEEIEKLRFSKMFFNPFKMAKRMWALARAIGDQTTIDKLSNFITGYISELYQMKSEIEAILSILTLTKYNPIITINNQIDKIKFNISKIIQLTQEELDIFDNVVNKFFKYSSKDTFDSKKKRIIILQEIKLFLKKIIDNETVYQLKLERLYIPPRHLLPEYLRYISNSIYKNAEISYGSGLETFYTKNQQDMKFKDMRDYYLSNYFHTLFDKYTPKIMDYATNYQNMINNALADIERKKM
jgi:hypothetical protein